MPIYESPEHPLARRWNLATNIAEYLSFLFDSPIGLYFPDNGDVLWQSKSETSILPLENDLDWRLLDEELFTDKEINLQNVFHGTVSCKLIGANKEGQRIILLIPKDKGLLESQLNIIERFFSTAGIYDRRIEAMRSQLIRIEKYFTGIDQLNNSYFNIVEKIPYDDIMDMQTLSISLLSAILENTDFIFGIICLSPNIPSIVDKSFVYPDKYINLLRIFSSSLDFNSIQQSGDGIHWLQIEDRAELNVPEIRDTGARSALIAPLRFQSASPSLGTMALFTDQNLIGGKINSMDIYMVNILASFGSVYLNAIIHRHEQILNAKKKELYLYQMFHGLKSPLYGINHYSDMLFQQLESGSINKNCFNIIEKIKKAATDSTRDVDKVLSYARLENGQRPLAIERLSMIYCVHFTIDQFKALAHARGISLEAKCDDQLYATADSDDVKTILSNLLENAIKYTQEGGFIYLEITKRDEMVCISVRDTGCGIAKKDIEYIWEPFMRMLPVDRDDIPGFGIGLALVKELTIRNNSRCEVASEPGEGSTFTIWLPLNLDNEISEDH